MGVRTREWGYRTPVEGSGTESEKKSGLLDSVFE